MTTETTEIRLGVSFEEWEKSFLERAREFPNRKYVNPKALSGFAGYMSHLAHSSQDGSISVHAKLMRLDDNQEFDQLNRADLFLHSAFQGEDGGKYAILAESPLWFTP